MACPLFRVIVVVLLAGAAAAAAESRTWQLMHSFDSGLTFTNRGQISLALNDEGSIEISVTNADDFIAWPTVNSITDPKILYQIKLLKDEHDDSMAILTSVSVCQLRRASFRDEIAVALNSHADPISITYTPLVSRLAPECHELSSNAVEGDVTPPSFKSSIKFVVATPGMTIPNLLPRSNPPGGLKFFPRPPGATDIPGVTKPGGNDTGMQSLLLKYWYIVLPIMIMLLTSNAEEPPPSQPQQGRGNAAVAAPVAGARTNTATASHNGPVRRGKRG